VDDDFIRSFARKLLEQGLVGVDAWGPGCGGVDTVFDLAIFDWDDERGVRRPYSRHIYTSSHEDEMLVDALWYAVRNERPMEGYLPGWRSVLTVVVGPPEWTDQIEPWLSDLDLLDSEAVPEQDD